MEKNKMKKCKFCQMDIPYKSKVCPNCKRTLKSPGCLTYIISFIAVIAITIVISISMNDSIQGSLSGVDEKSEYITLDEYNRIQTGMSYDEVVEIIGSSGSETATSSMNNITIKMYTWYGNGVAGSSANVTFTNNEVTAKAQAGLK